MKFESNTISMFETKPGYNILQHVLSTAYADRVRMAGTVHSFQSSYICNTSVLALLFSMSLYSFFLDHLRHLQLLLAILLRY